MKTAYEATNKASKKIYDDNMHLGHRVNFRASYDGKSATVHILSELEEFFEQVAPHRGDAGIREIGKIAEQRYGVTLPAYQGTAPEIIDAWASARAESIAAFDEAAKARDEARAEAGIMEADRLDEEAWKAFNEAEMAVLATKPTTPAGGLALVQFCAEYMAQYETDEKIAPALVNAALAMASISGADLVVSKRLASLYADNWPPVESKPDLPRELLENYHTWLFFEYQAMCDELSPYGRSRQGDFVYLANPAAKYHDAFSGDRSATPAPTRAATVLAAVGCDWQEEPRK
jgi:hypothetical protein